MRSIKCVVVGDGAVGKTSLLISYTTNTFPRDYVPTVFDNYSTTLLLPGRKGEDEEPQIYRLNLWDTAGQEEYDRLRPLSYPQTDIFLVCFSISEPSSLRNVVDKWYPEIVENTSPSSGGLQRSGDKYPMFLVGTKADLRDDAAERRRLLEVNADFVTSEQIEEVVKRCGFMGYVECSAATQTGVREVFERSVATIVSEPDRLARARAKAEAEQQEAAAAAAAADAQQPARQQDQVPAVRPERRRGSPGGRPEVSRKGGRPEKARLVSKMKKKSKCVIL